MERIEFRDSLLIGHPEIDAEHRELIALLNACIDIVNTTADRRAFVAAFEEYFSSLKLHIEHEEQIMEQCGYRESDLETKLHHDSVELMTSLLDDAKGQVALENIIKQTVRVVVEVVLKADLPFKGYLQTLDEIPMIQRKRA